MKECAGVVIIALERTYFPAGTERRGHAKEMELREVRLPTPFNQIEAAMAYCHKHPLLVIVEEGLRCEGLLEAGHDWSVMRVAPKPEALSTPEFHGILASWKDKVIARGKESQPSTAPDVTQMTISQLVGLLKPIHLWLILGALASLIAGAFSLGVKLGGH